MSLQNPHAPPSRHRFSATWRPPTLSNNTTSLTTCSRSGQRDTPSSTPRHRPASLTPDILPNVTCGLYARPSISHPASRNGPAIPSRNRLNPSDSTPSHNTLGRPAPPNTPTPPILIPNASTPSTPFPNAPSSAPLLPSSVSPKNSTVTCMSSPLTHRIRSPLNSRLNSSSSPSTSTATPTNNRLASIPPLFHTPSPLSNPNPPRLTRPPPI